MYLHAYVSMSDTYKWAHFEQHYISAIVSVARTETIKISLMLLVYGSTLTSCVGRSPVVHESCRQEPRRTRVVSAGAPSYTSRVGRSPVVHESCLQEPRRTRVVSAGAPSYTSRVCRPRRTRENAYNCKSQT